MGTVLTTPGTHRILTTKLGISGMLVLKSRYGTRLGKHGDIIEDIISEPKFKRRHIGRDSTIVITPDGTLQKVVKPSKKKTVKKQAVPKEPKERMLNKTKIKGLILAMVNMLKIEFRYPFLCFYTISFPPVVNEKMAKRVLNILLTRLGMADLIWADLWVMEFQKNGTPHFHLLIPSKLNVRMVNRIVRTTLQNMILKKELNWSLLEAKKYNGVDIAGRKVNGKKVVTNFADPDKSKVLSWYVTKYITKNETKSPAQLWHCSRSWASLCTGITCTDQEAKKFWPFVENEPLEGEYFSFYRWVGGIVPDSLLKYLAKVNRLVTECFVEFEDGMPLRMRKELIIGTN